MQKSYINGTILSFSKSYSAIVTKTYWTLKKAESVNMTILLLFTLSELHNIRGHILNIPKHYLRK